MDDAVITDLAVRARDGDRAAATRWVELTQHQVWRLLVHLTDRAAAEDLTQETYERAFAALRRFRAESSARTWLLSITRRVAVDHLRRRARRPVAPAPILEGDRPLGHPRGGELAEGVALRAAVDGLDTDRREAFVLTQVLGLGYAEAALVCGCPVGTIRSRVARARADLVEVVRPGTDAAGATTGTA